MNKIKLSVILIILFLGIVFNTFAASTITVDGGIWIYTNKVYLVLTPTESTQAVNKAYVDNATNFTEVAIHGSAPNIRQTDSNTNKLSIYGGNGTGAEIDLYGSTALGGYSNFIWNTADIVQWWLYAGNWTPSFSGQSKIFNMANGIISSGTVSNLTIDASCTFKDIKINGSSPTVRQTDSSTNFLSLWGGDGTGSRLQLYAPLGGYSNGILATCNTFFWFMPGWVPNLQTPDNAFNLSGGKIQGGTVSNCTIDSSCTFGNILSSGTNTANSCNVNYLNVTNSQIIGTVYATNATLTICGMAQSTNSGSLDLIETSIGSPIAWGTANNLGFRITYDGSDNYLKFKSGSGVTTNDRLTIDRDTGNVYFNGNVGIGITNPLSRLHVEAISGGTGVVTIAGNLESFTTVGQEFASLQFRSGDSSVNNPNRISGRIVSVSEISNGSYAGLAFETFTQGGTPTNLTEKMRIAYNGNVGIGTANPLTALHVSGSINVGTTGTNFLYYLNTTNYVAMWAGTNAYYLQCVTNGINGPVKTNLLWQ